MLLLKEQIAYFKNILVNSIYQHAFNLTMHLPQTSDTQSKTCFSDLLNKLDIDYPLEPFFQTLDDLKTALFKPTDIDRKERLLEKLKSDLYPSLICFLDEQSSVLSLPKGLTEDFISAFSTWLRLYQKQCPELNELIIEIRSSAYESYRTEQARIRQATVQSQLYDAKTALNAFTAFTGIVKKHLPSKVDFPKDTKIKLLALAPLFQAYVDKPWFRIRTIDDISGSKWQHILTFSENMIETIENDIKHANLVIQQCLELRKSCLNTIKKVPTVPQLLTHQFISDHEDEDAYHELKGKVFYLNLQVLSEEDVLVLLDEYIALLGKHCQQRIKLDTPKQKAVHAFYQQQLEGLSPADATPYIQDLKMALLSDDTTYEDILNILESLPSKIRSNIDKYKTDATTLQKKSELTLAKHTLLFNSMPEDPSLQQTHAIDNEMRRLYGVTPSHFDLKKRDSAHQYFVYSLLYESNIILARALSTQEYALFVKAKQRYDTALIEWGKKKQTHLTVIASYIKALKTLFEENCPYIPSSHSAEEKPIFHLSTSLSSGLRHDTTLSPILLAIENHKRRLQFPTTKDKAGILRSLINTVYPQLLLAICDLEKKNEIIPGQLFSQVYDALLKYHQELIIPHAERSTELDDSVFLYFTLNHLIKNKQQVISTNNILTSKEQKNLNYLDLPLIESTHLDILQLLEKQLSESPKNIQEIKKSYLKAYKYLATHDPIYHVQYLRVKTEEKLLSLQKTVGSLTEELQRENTYYTKQLNSIKAIERSARNDCVAKLNAFFDRRVTQETDKCHTNLIYLHLDLIEQVKKDLSEKRAETIQQSFDTESPSAYINFIINKTITEDLERMCPLFRDLDDKMKALHTKLLTFGSTMPTQDKKRCLSLLKLIQNDSASPEERTEALATYLKQTDYATLLEVGPQQNKGALLSRFGFLKSKQATTPVLTSTQEHDFSIQ